MLEKVGTFLMVWAAWSFLDVTVLRQYHPWVEAAFFLFGLNLVIPWDELRERAVNRPSSVATLDRV